MVFKPLGDKARWVIIYDALKKLGPDDLLSYEQMGTLLNVDPAYRKDIISAAARRAVQELERKDNRTCRIQRGIGYCIATPKHQIELAQRHQGLAARHIATAHTKITTVDLNQIEDPEARKGIELMGFALAEQARFIGATNIRQTRLEDALLAVAAGQRESDERIRAHERRTDQELTDLRAQLAELASKVESGPAAAPPEQAAPEPPPAPGEWSDVGGNGIGALFKGPPAR